HNVVYISPAAEAVIRANGLPFGSFGGKASPSVGRLQIGGTVYNRLERVTYALELAEASMPSTF
ncbi:MAG: hypothetical protein WBZ19_02740, partial [Chthoniobacterales bacterium]